MFVNIVLVLVGSLCVVANGQISSYFNPNDAQALIAKSRGVISSSKSLKDIYYALNFLKASDHSDFGCQCNSLQDLVSKANTGYDIFYGLNSASVCNCDVKVPSEFSSIAKKAVQVCVDKLAHDLYCTNLLPSLCVI